MKHKFQSSVAQGADNTLVGPNQWNDFHVHDVQNVSVNTTLDATHDFIRATAGASGIIVTLPTAASIQGKSYTIKRVDNGAGNVVIATTASQTIDGQSTYTLINQFQLVELVSDGSNWMIRLAS